MKVGVYANKSRGREESRAQMLITARETNKKQSLTTDSLASILRDDDHFDEDGQKKLFQVALKNAIAEWCEKRAPAKVVSKSVSKSEGEARLRKVSKDFL